MTALNLFIISVLSVFIVDYSSFITEMERYIGVLMGRPAKIPKPFSCGLCTSFWLSILFLIFTNSLSFINLLLIAVFCALTPEVLHAFYTLRDIADKALTVLDNWLKMIG